MRTPLCAKNHPMNFMTLQQIIVVSPEYTNGCQCDWCHGTPVGKIYHCNICNYDICMKCVSSGVQTPHHIDSACSINEHSYNQSDEHRFR